MRWSAVHPPAVVDKEEASPREDGQAANVALSRTLTAEWMVQPPELPRKQCSERLKALDGE